MRASIIRIGNSRGIRIPRAMLEQVGLREAVELEVRAGELVIRPIDEPRRGWDEAFRRMAEQGDDGLLDRESIGPTAWDESEWEW